MSFAMAPHSAFISLVKALALKHGIICQESRPLWVCRATVDQYNTLPSIKFKMITNPQGETKEFLMPRQAYMKFNPEDPNFAKLYFVPKEFKGLGRLKGEEYWILGAQFL